MSRAENLWNVDADKTRKVVAYIEALEPFPSWSPNEVKLFEKRIEIALSQITANQMLTHIGYVYGQRPVLYSYVTEWGKENEKNNYRH
jgi:hypothetical protein